MTKLEKNSFGTFFKNRFLSICVNLKKFSDKGTQNFFSLLSYQSGHKLPIYAKKLLKIIFGALRELYLIWIIFKFNSIKQKK